MEIALKLVRRAILDRISWVNRTSASSTTADGWPIPDSVLIRNIEIISLAACQMNYVRLRSRVNHLKIESSLFL